MSLGSGESAPAWRALQWRMGSFAVAQLVGVGRLIAVVASPHLHDAPFVSGQPGIDAWIADGKTRPGTFDGETKTSEGLFVQDCRGDVVNTEEVPVRRHV